MFGTYYGVFDGHSGRRCVCMCVCVYACMNVDDDVDDDVYVCVCGSVM